MKPPVKETPEKDMEVQEYPKKEDVKDPNADDEDLPNEVIQLVHVIVTGNTTEEGNGKLPPQFYTFRKPAKGKKGSRSKSKSKSRFGPGDGFGSGADFGPGGEPGAGAGATAVGQ